MKLSEANLNQHDMSQNRLNRMRIVSDEIHCLKIVSFLCIFNLTKRIIAISFSI